MDFNFSDDQDLLRDMVSRWADKGYGFERRRALVKAGGFSRDVWGELAGLGLTGLTVPEGHGGMGFGAVEAMIVSEELGRAMVLEPYAQGALLAPALFSHASEAQRAEWLPKVTAGEALVVLAHQERQARYRLNHVSTSARPNGDAWVLEGDKSIVPAGDRADAFIVPARVSGAVDDPAGIALFLVTRGAVGLAARGYSTQDGGRAAELQLHAVRAELITEDGHAALEHAVDIGLAAHCAEAVGLMDGLVAVTIDYMNTRQQFGVSIASFQALRHRIADVKMQLELGRSMSYYASLKLAEPRAERRRALSQAKVQLGQSMRFVGQQCIQLHGGIGLTDEYIGSHYFKRLTALEMRFGDTLHHLGEVSARMEDTAGVFA